MAGLSGIGHEPIEHWTNVGIAPKTLSVARVITARNLKPEFVALDGSAERWIHLPQLQQLRRICETERPQGVRNVAPDQSFVAIAEEDRPVKLVTSIFRDKIDQK